MPDIPDVPDMPDHARRMDFCWWRKAVCLVSVGVHWTSIRLSAAVQSFLVEFNCWFGEILPEVWPESLLDSLVQQACTGKLLDYSSSSRAKNLAFWIGQVQWSLTRVQLEKGGSVKTSTFYVILSLSNTRTIGISFILRFLRLKTSRPASRKPMFRRNIMCFNVKLLTGDRCS